MMRVKNTHITKASNASSSDSKKTVLVSVTVLGNPDNALKRRPTLIIISTNYKIEHGLHPIKASG